MIIRHMQLPNIGCLNSFLGNFSCRVLAASFLFWTTACSSPTTSTQKDLLTIDWVLNGLDSPESVLPSENGDFFYVSNVNGEGAEKNNKGYISRVSIDGKIIERSWASELNAPKGMALSNGTLYVADIDRLVLIDVATAQIVSSVEVPGAKFLNDVVSSPMGILISDSANKRIYKYSAGEIHIWLEDERLSGVNGLLAEEDRLIITTMDSGSLFTLGWDADNVSMLATGMKNADGVTVLANGSFLVSSWPGELYYIEKNSHPKILLDTKSQGIYLNDFYLKDDQLVIPNWQPGSLRSYSFRLSND